MELKLTTFTTIIIITCAIIRAEDDKNSVDFVRVAIVIDNSTNATPIWRQTTATLEATAKFFTFYDKKLLANQTRFVIAMMKLPIFDDPLAATLSLCKRIQKETNLVGIILTDSTPTFRRFIGELSGLNGLPVVELFTISAMSMMPDQTHFHFYMCDFLMPAVQETIEAYRWVNMLLIYDTPLNLACVNQLLGNPKQIGHALAMAVSDATLYEAVYTIKVKWKAVIVAFDEARTIRFLQLALRMGILSNDYTFIFTNPDIHLHSMEEFAHNQPNVTFYRFVSRNNFTMEIIKVAREFEEIQPKYKLLAPVSTSKYDFENVLAYDQETQISMPSAMLFDALLLFRTALENLILNAGLQRFSEYANSVSCKNPSIIVQAKAVAQALARGSIEGLTGTAKFNRTTRLRDTFVIDVLGLGSMGLRRIGTYSTEGVKEHSHKPGVSHQLFLEKDINLLLHPSPAFFVRPNKTDTDEPKRPIVSVTTLLEKPYVMYRSDRSKKKAFFKSRAIHEHNFEGYCIDLLEEIATIVGFDYSIHLVADGKYGSYNASSGRWNGMVGEVVDAKATMAVAPLTITYAREQAVDFTKPFINLGIAILYVQPFKTSPSMFSFMQPLASDVWIAVALAFGTVTTVFFFLGRFSDCAYLGISEDHNKHQEHKLANISLSCLDRPSEVKPPRQSQSKLFSFVNSAHFTIGGIVHHGSTVVPTTWPARIISVFWWFFAMIIISSYTANLAAFLTVETLASPFENAEELAQQQRVLYGAVKGGATENFFRESKIDTYKKMWAFMKDKDVFPRNNSEGIARVRRSKGGYAYLMESVSMAYIISNDNKDCQLRQVGGLLDSKGYGIAMAKESPILHDVSMAILQLQEGDRLHWLYEKWWKASGQSCQTEDNRAKVLEIQNVYGVFVILSVGLTLALIALPSEILWYHHKKRNCYDKRSFFKRVVDTFRIPFLNSKERCLILMEMNNCVCDESGANSDNKMNNNIWQMRNNVVKESGSNNNNNVLVRRMAFREQHRTHHRQTSQSLERDYYSAGDDSNSPGAVFITKNYSPAHRHISTLAVRNAPPSPFSSPTINHRNHKRNNDNNTTPQCNYWHLHRSHSFKEISV